jgi:hypothetical protein
MKTPLLKAKCINDGSYFQITNGNTYYVRESSPTNYEVYRSQNEDSFVSIFNKTRFKLIEEEPMIKVKCTADGYVCIKRGQTYLAKDDSNDFYDVYDLDQNLIGCYSKRNFTVVKEETEVEILARKLKESEELAHNLKKELEIAKLREKHGDNSLIGVDIDALNKCIDSGKLEKLIGGMGNFKVRNAGNYRNLGFYLSCHHSWKIENDSTGVQVLVPTKLV